MKNPTPYQHSTPTTEGKLLAQANAGIVGPLPPEPAGEAAELVVLK